ncbi:MAG: ferritin-like domain-containing protein [Chitinophagaceae bacterium]|nr:ferritin-like domain-containing protein [Chitinophagaceae bacterium]
MFLQNIISEIEKKDPEVFDRLDTRRSALRSFSGLGKKLALTALPFAFGSMFKKAYAGTTGTNDVIDVLNFALTLEYLEAEFYKNGLDSPGLIAPQLRPSFQKIYDHEAAHVEFLKGAITGAGGMPVPKPTFDFTAGNGSGNGPFAGVFSNPTLFLFVAQTFEDTGVRAYKGQAPNLLGTGDVLTAALNIHSVEARHAAHVRLISRLYSSGVGDVKPWITLNNSNIPSAAVQPSYNGEEVTTQAGINIVNINGFPISAEQASEAFDEFLTKEQVLAIVDPFIV